MKDGENMILGNIFSFLAAIVLMASYIARRKPVRFSFFFNIAEALLLSASSWCLGMKASAIIFVVRAVSLMVMVIYKYETRELLIAYVLMLLAICIWDNRQGVSTALIILAMARVLYIRMDRYVMHDNFYSCPLHGGWGDFASTELNLILWIIYFLIAHDYNSIVVSGVLLIRNAYILIVTKLSKRAREERTKMKRMHERIQYIRSNRREWY